MKDYNPKKKLKKMKKSKNKSKIIKKDEESSDEDIISLVTSSSSKSEKKRYSTNEKLNKNKVELITEETKSKIKAEYNQKHLMHKSDILNTDSIIKSDDENEFFNHEQIGTSRKPFVFNLKMENYLDINKNKEFAKVGSSPTHSLSVKKSGSSNASNHSHSIRSNIYKVSNSYKADNFAFSSSYQNPICLPGIVDAKFLQFQECNMPPLPTDSAPERPPEPVFDMKRLSNKKISIMFQSCDITKKNLKKFFEREGKIYDVPSPPPSSSSSYTFLSQVVETDNNLSSKVHPIITPLQNMSKLSSNQGKSNSSSSSDISNKKSSSTRSCSYFTSSSSEHSSVSSSGSDIDRPCRHYRPKRKQYKRKYGKSSSDRSSSDFSYYSE